MESFAPRVRSTSHVAVTPLSVFADTSEMSPSVSGAEAASSALLAAGPRMRNAGSTSAGRPVESVSSSYRATATPCDPPDDTPRTSSHWYCCVNDITVSSRRAVVPHISDSFTYTRVPVVDQSADVVPEHSLCRTSCGAPSATMRIRSTTCEPDTDITSTPDVPAAGTTHTVPALAMGASAATGVQHPVHARQRASSSCARPTGAARATRTAPAAAFRIRLLIIVPPRTAS
jgi:hypothetical protein